MDPEAGESYQNSNSQNQQVPGGSKIKEIRNDLNQLTNIVSDSINKVMIRSERLDALNERSELLSRYV